VVGDRPANFWSVHDEKHQETGEQRKKDCPRDSIQEKSLIVRQAQDEQAERRFGSRLSVASWLGHAVSLADSGTQD
jgi:hypothetical protein